MDGERKLLTGSTIINFQPLRHVESYLSGKLTPYLVGDAKAKGHSSSVEDLTLGVRERFDEGPNADIGKNRLVEVLSQSDGSFNFFLRDRKKDGVILFHADDGSCLPCERFSPYYSRYLALMPFFFPNQLTALFFPCAKERIAKRFRELRIRSLNVARFDLAKGPAPDFIANHLGRLPAIVLIRANAKEEPLFFSGAAKVLPVMQWVHQHVALPFTLPELPHLSNDEQEIYKEQVREREAKRDKSSKEQEVGKEEL